jgi:transcriptional regulator with XRE-family HTH domain
VSRPAQIDPVERKVVLLLKKERLRRGVSATQLAAGLGISRTTVTHIENDDARPTLWVLIKIAEGLGVTFSELMAEAEKAATPTEQE